jgi:hypothetical protein
MRLMTDSTPGTLAANSPQAALCAAVCPDPDVPVLTIRCTSAGDLPSSRRRTSRRNADLGARRLRHGSEGLQQAMLTMPNHLAVAHHRQTLDEFFHPRGDNRKLRLFLGNHHRMAHDLGDRLPMRLQVVPRQRVFGGEHGGPRRTPLLRADLGATDEVSLAHDPEQPARRLDDRQCADPLAQQQACGVEHACIRSDANDLRSHDVGYLHGFYPRDNVEESHRQGQPALI